MTGFSLVEVLAAIAVLGVLSTVIMKLMDNANKSAKTIEAKDEISQLQREISDLLSNPNNCQATLGQRTVGAAVPIVYHMVNGVPTPKITPSTLASTKAKVQAIEVKSIDINGDGSQAIGTLDVTFLKPSNALGGRDIKKEIKFNANLCAKNLISGATNQAILSQCSGAGFQLIQGPYDWNSSKWAVCQDCNSASSNPIMTCQSTGGGGVDVGNISQLSCVSLGGTFDEATSRCLFLGLTLEQLIESKVNPNNFVNSTAPTCPPGGTYSLAVVNGKIQMNCTAPPSCSSCAGWGSWYVYTKSWHCAYGCKNISLDQGTRTTCSYQKDCTTKAPAGCVGSVSPTQSNGHVYNESDGGGKWRYKNRDEAAGGSCPGPGTFGI